MGPRPFRRGNPFLTFLLKLLGSGFNGATPFQAWKRRLTATIIGLSAMLQWGHALSGVETTCEPVLNAGISRFNGATPFQAWKRNFRCLAAGQSSALQWGHALSGVETKVSDLTAQVDITLQWGHALSGVETRLSDIGFWLNDWLQWGHALSGVETEIDIPEDEAIRRFNGATPFQAWKHGFVGAFS